MSNIFSKENNEVIIYDSYYDSISHITDSTWVILDILYAHFPYKVTFASRRQKQMDVTSCGRWAIAYAYDLALGHDPANTLYDEVVMIDHLFTCMNEGLVKPFPGVRNLKR